MDLYYFIKGIIVGVAIAVPVGPIGVLCIHRTLAESKSSGLVSGLGAATADAVYGSVAAFGLTALSGFIVGNQALLGLLGGIFLLFLGVRTLRAETITQTDDEPTMGLFASYASTFFLTLTNPATILAFIAVFAGMGIVNGQGGYANAAIVVLGVFIGSAAWWIVLIGTATIFRVDFTPKWLKWTNRISGAILTGFGVVALASVYFLMAD